MSPAIGLSTKKLNVKIARCSFDNLWCSSYYYYAFNVKINADLLFIWLEIYQGTRLQITKMIDKVI